MKIQQQFQYFKRINLKKKNIKKFDHDESRGEVVSAPDF